MIHPIPYATTEGLRREMAVFEQSMTDETFDNLSERWPTVGEYIGPFLQSAEGLQFTQAMTTLRPGARVLDVGVGGGYSTLYLASQGYQVSAVEPSLVHCRLLDRAAEHFELPLTIFQTTAETIDRLGVTGFEVCLFNASLHHCDDPVRALANCRSVLSPGGTVFLLNEPQLQLFRSKSKFYRQLEESPEEMGHYGGNEHIYYHHEYVAMLRQAGFAEIQDHLSLRYQNPDNYLAGMQGRKVSRAKILARRAYYGAIRGLLHGGPLGGPVLAILRRLSLLQSYFTATKPAARAAA